ncbi:MAG: stage II sporulation protein R [Candidatus Cohnella colombiensis]|uniref:Stage II sporulation protein R n=1 Tax=Candidatus Cohnella colombiensis TaxID=3121368 RepID=A0AA95EVN6_9BACL|nr:MAG: stage II sporulation protein R [Cohnella sp.]
MRNHSYSNLSNVRPHLSIIRKLIRSLVICIALFIGTAALIGKFVAAASADSTIPEDAIRIRIIANSDSTYDQQLKSKVRDDIATFIESWGEMPATQPEVLALIQDHLSNIQSRVDTMLKDAGASYDGTAELGEVPFPEKAFEGASYEAGNYLALRITLGEGNGANWWCVLFPPLCLTAAQAPDDQAQATQSADQQISVEDDQPKAKFFLWELLEKLFAFIASLFS